MGCIFQLGILPPEFSLCLLLAETTACSSDPLSMQLPFKDLSVIEITRFPSLQFCLVGHRSFTFHLLPSSCLKKDLISKILSVGPPWARVNVCTDTGRGSAITAHVWMFPMRKELQAREPQTPVFSSQPAHLFKSGCLLIYRLFLPTWHAQTSFSRRDSVALPPPPTATDPRCCLGQHWPWGE